MAELVAVVCVVESSLILASEWNTILTEYILPLFKRLGEAHVAQLFRLAFIAYGPANAQSSPLIEKRFFATLPMITKELREEQQKLGIGRTSSGGSRGMAALEGLVASIEMFDILSDSIKLKPLQSQSTNQAPYVAPRLVSHIIHVAASPPDGAPKPLWNDSPKLDNATWASLPSELKKRNINLSVINMRPNPQFVELHSLASSKGVSSPWFKIRSPHSVLLSGFPTETKSKRPHDSLASPDTKRAKIQTPAALPNPNTNASPTPALAVQPVPSLAPQSEAPGQTAPSLPRGGLPSAAIMTKYRELEAHVNKLKRDATIALTQGRAEVAAQIKKEHDTSAATLEKFKQAMQAAVRQGHIGRPQNGLPPAANQPLAASHSMQTSQVPQTVAPPIAVMPNSGTPGFPQNGPGRTGGPPFPQMANLDPTPNPSQMTPEMASQMQKLVENHGIRPRQASLSQSTFTPKLAPPQLPQPMAIASPSQQEANMTWEGALTWTGFDVTTHDRKEMHAQVKVASLSRTDIMPRTWPTTLNLTPSREPMATPVDIQNWAKITKATLCSFSPNPRNGDPQINGQNWRSLIELLSQKRIYALASWTLPSGKLSNNILMFPFNNNLLGAVFPTTGIPGMPKSAGTPGAIPIPPQPQLQIPPQLQEQFKKLNPEQRSIVIARMMNQRKNAQQQQQLQLQQQQGFQPQAASQPGTFALPGNAGAFAGQPNFQTQATHNMMNLMGNSNMSGAQMMNMMGAQPNLPHRRTPSDNPMPQAAIGYDVMQSFLQRNADGSGGAGMGA